MVIGSGSASSGVDAQPFFRIFNPWRQQERFDTHSKYIKKWLPELNELSAQEINKWADLSPTLLTDYPAPIVEQKKNSEETKAKYKTAHENSKS